MSSQELVTAYSQGRISRRALIRRLVAGGISMGAAVSYAHLLDPERATARALGNQHEITVAGKILKQDLAKVIDKEKVKVKFTIPKRSVVRLRIWLERPERKVGGYALIGDHTIMAPKGTSKVGVPLDVNPPSSVDALRPLDEAMLDLSTVAEREGHVPDWGAAFHERTLRHADV